MSASSKKPKHILVVRLSAMGDVALLAPVLNAVLQQHPTLQITLITLAKWVPIFKDLPRLELLAVHPKHTHKGVFGVWRLAKAAKTAGFTAIADMHNVLRAKLLRVFLSFSGVPTAVIHKGRVQKKALTRPKNKVFTPLKHTSERYADVFRRLGIPIILCSKALLTKPQAAIPAKPILKPLIGIAPFAAHASKQYPLALLKQALKLLIDKEDKYQLVFFGGGPIETQHIKELCQYFPKSTHTLNESFEQQLGVISNLDLMLSMDSGNAHLAALYGVPTLTLWGNTHPYAGFAPFLQPETHRLLANREQFPLIPTSVFGKSMPKGYEKAMETITPQAVVQKIKEML